MYERLSNNQISFLSKLSNKIRGNILKMTTLAKSGHPGGSMSCAEIVLTIYSLMKHNPQNPKWEQRDSLIVSNGHISPLIYSVLGEIAYFNLEQAIAYFRKAGSIFEGHIEIDVPGVEYASGNLGQGLSVACGIALANKFKGVSAKTFVLMGDGEQQKGQLSEARRFAAKYSLKDIIAFVDYNRLQINGETKKIMPQDIRAEYRAEGWDYLEVDGHNFDEIQNAIIKAEHSNKPMMILAETIMGKGVSFMENKAQYHGSPLSEEQLDLALKELSLENNLEKYKKMRAEFSLLPKKNNENFVCDANLASFKTNKIYEEKTDCRTAWGETLVDIAKDMEKPVIVFDCDVAASVKTNLFEKIFPNYFFQAGIAEHHTVSMAGAISKEFLTFVSLFGVFGVDEVYNMLRMNDINRCNLKMVLTHVGLDVGEDGKTHQCIDYIALLRNLFGFKVIMPADANQTSKVIKYIASTKGNFLVAMGRSKLDIIKDENKAIYFNHNYNFIYGKADKLCNGNNGVLLSYGNLINKAVNVAKELNLSLWNVSCPTCIDKEILKEIAYKKLVFTYEDHNVNTGLACVLANSLLENEIYAKLIRFGVNNYACSGTSEEVYKLCGLDEISIKKKIMNIIDEFKNQKGVL